MEITDAELVKRTLSGNQDAFAELMTRYKKMVCNVIYNLTNNQEELPDLCQEVFIKIYKSLASYNSDYKFATWAIKITTNLCLDRLRARRNKIKAAPMEEAFEVSNGEATPEEKFLARERDNFIRKLVNELPEKYRVPLVLFHQNGVPYEEIAKILNQPMTIVKNRLYRARLLLREKLIQHQKEEGFHEQAAL